MSYHPPRLQKVRPEASKIQKSMPTKAAPDAYEIVFGPLRNCFRTPTELLSHPYEIVFATSAAKYQSTLKSQRQKGSENNFRSHRVQLS